MDKDTTQKVRGIVRRLAINPWHRATFISLTSGDLVFHEGDANAFSPNGADVPNVAKNDTADESLYVASVGTRHLIGVIFADSADIDDVRAAVAPVVEPLVAELDG